MCKGIVPTTVIHWRLYRECAGHKNRKRGDFMPGMATMLQTESANMENRVIERYMQMLKEIVHKDIRIEGSIVGYLLEDMLQAAGSYQPIIR